MKLIYTIHSLYNPGGMERVLLNKVRWWVKHSVDVVVVTTDQHDRPTFYPFPEGVRMIDLGINYSDDNGLSTVKKALGYFRRRAVHKKKLTELLMAEKADIVDCFYPGECSFVPDIQDGSKKVLELHQSKLFHAQYNRKGLMGLADKIRARMDDDLVRRFEKFVVLTQEDAKMWGDIPNIEVIPNAAMFVADKYSDCSEKRVIAVGRLDYQKSFDRLIEVWEIVHPYAPDWRLDIFGQGEWKDMLNQMIKDKGLESCVKINEPTKNIGVEYAKSSILVMSSHYEGFPMVMIEGMACGLPAVSFDFKCGPRDIIDDGVNGYIVEDGDIGDLAQGLLNLIKDEPLRKSMGGAAKSVVERYSEEKVMSKWENCYKSLNA